MPQITPDQNIESREAARNELSSDRSAAGHIEREYDQRDTRFIGGISIVGMIVAGALGAGIGLAIAALVDADVWWAGVVVGFFVGGVVGGLVPARFAMEALEREVRPPQETQTTGDGTRPQPR